MKFKNFEIRPCKDVNGVDSPYKYEIVKWYNPDSCYTVAWFEYDNRDSHWDLRSVGLRLIESWADGLDKFIIRWCDLMTVCIEEGGDDEDG